MIRKIHIYSSHTKQIRQSCPKSMPWNTNVPYLATGSQNDIRLSPCDGKAGSDLGGQSLLVWSHVTMDSNILYSKSILIFKVCNVMKKVGKDFYEVLAHFTEEELEACSLGNTLKGQPETYNGK